MEQEEFAMMRIRETMRDLVARWGRLDTVSRQILLVLVTVAVLLSVPAALINGDWAGLLLNLGTELAGAAVTFVLLDQIVGANTRKRDLSAQLSSQVNDVAKAAAEDLRRHGWLVDGSLQQVQLSQANLQDANLRNANLREVVLFQANLQGADLRGADLSGAILTRANLGGANLSGAALTAAAMLNVECDPRTILPDGSHWTPRTSLHRYTGLVDPTADF
ncbi:MAG: pentapeptide repeat-containing protein [Chloroflexi bacterium]|nr:pentapeptide repeat-containing protein [Chloroflexota bacterium]